MAGPRKSGHKAGGWSLTDDNGWHVVVTATSRGMGRLTARKDGRVIKFDDTLEALRKVDCEAHWRHGLRSHVVKAAALRNRAKVRGVEY